MDEAARQHAKALKALKVKEDKDMKANQAQMKKEDVASDKAQKAAIKKEKTDLAEARLLRKALGKAPAKRNSAEHAAVAADLRRKYEKAKNG